MSPNANRNDIYHWFVACTWFYHQNAKELNNTSFNLDDMLISCSMKEIESEFAEYMSSHGEKILPHTKKQIGDLYQTHNQQIGEFLKDIIDTLTTDHHHRGHRGHNGSGSVSGRDYVERIWSEPELMSCIESSFASMVAARYSLLRSVYVTFVYLRVRSQAMAAVLDLLKGYFVLSFLSSSIYETKQSLGLCNYRDRAVSADKRQRLMAELQSSFRSGLLIRHYLRYWYTERGGMGGGRRADQSGPMRLDLDSESGGLFSLSWGVMVCHDVPW